jgi:hypothetical protein
MMLRGWQWLLSNILNYSNKMMRQKVVLLKDSGETAKQNTKPFPLYLPPTGLDESFTYTLIERKLNPLNCPRKWKI